MSHAMHAASPRYPTLQDRLLTAHQPDHSASAQWVVAELLRNDAPLSMMYTLCGMTAGEYAFLRRPGHPCTRGPTDAEIIVAWEAYETCVDDIDRMTPYEWAVLGCVVDVSLRVMWPLFQRWALSRDTSAALAMT
ncbi:MAG: hypothetical protein ACR2RB_10825 [Gammaproteobacteria bacterium]